MKDNSKIIIRKAKVEDVSKIIPLLRGIAQYHYNFNPAYLPGSKLPADSAQRLTKLVRKRKTVLLIAEVDKKIVSYFVADVRKVRMFVHKEIGYISNGYVDTKYRRKGIGEMMLKWLRGWFLERGIERVELMVDTKNDLGIRAWQKYGFREYQKKMWLKI